MCLVLAKKHVSISYQLSPAASIAFTMRGGRTGTANSACSGRQMQAAIINHCGRPPCVDPSELKCASHLIQQLPVRSLGYQPKQLWIYYVRIAPPIAPPPPPPPLLHCCQVTRGCLHRHTQRPSIHSCTSPANAANTDVARAPSVAIAALTRRIWPACIKKVSPGEQENH